MSQADGIVVEGQVAFRAGDRPGRAARVVVRVEDVSRADAPATTVAEQVLRDVALPPDGGALPFEVAVPAGALDPQGRYVLRVHVDVGGTGAVTAGDFVSTRSYPVRPGRQEAAVEVHPV